MSARPIDQLLDPNTRVVIAHRGNRIRRAENTIAALDDAVELGADALEFDVRMTRDGTPVLMHDPDLDRTTNGHGPLASYTFDEVRTLDAAARSPRPTGDRALVPSLEEALDRFRETPVVIEVKEVGAIDATERWVRRFNAQDRVLVGSSDAAVMQRIYCSGLTKCASMRDAAWLIPFALTGLMPPRPRYDVLSITLRFRGLPIPVLRMATLARQAGVATHVWTINDPAEARRLWVGGVAAIITDDPAAMLRVRPSVFGAGS